MKIKTISLEIMNIILVIWMFLDQLQFVEVV